MVTVDRNDGGRTMPRANWMEARPRLLHLDYHQPPWMRGVAAAVDEGEAARQARMFRDAGVEAVEIFAYDHYGQCFYPSEVGVVHPGLAADYTGLMARALKADGLKVILYLNVFTSVHLFARHPDWFIRGEDGSHPGGAWLAHPASHLCASSPYLERYFIPLLQEAVRRHGPDAVWLDAGCWLIETPCWCAHCATAFRAATGHDLPGGPPPSPSDELARAEWVAWHLWRRGQIGAYVARVVDAIKAVDPAVLVADNNLGRFSTGVPEVVDGRLRRWLAPADLGVDYLSCDPVPMGGNHELILSLEGRYQGTTGLLFSYMNERFNAWGEWQVRAATDWGLEARTVVAHGGSAFFADQPYPQGTLEPSVYRDLGQVYGGIAEFDRYLRGATPVSDMAILASLPSALLGPPGGAEWGRRSFANGSEVQGASGDRTDRIRGAHLVAVEAGLQALIYDEATLRGQLADQSAVVVADQCLLADDTIAALHDYARAGGRVLVTGRAGLWDDAGRPRDSDPLAALLGLRRTAPLSAPLHYLRPDPAWAGAAAVGDIPIQLWGPAMAVELHGAETRGALYEPRADVWRDGVRDRAHWQHYTVFGATPPGSMVAGPGITVNAYGAGRVLYLPVDPFVPYYREGQPALRRLILACLDHLVPVDQRLLAVTKPLHVEVILARQEGRLLVHLLNYAAQKRAGVLVNNEELTPVHDIMVRVRTEAAPARVSLALTGEPLPFEQDRGWTHVRLPRLDAHEIIVIEPHVQLPARDVGQQGDALSSSGLS